MIQEIALVPGNELADRENAVVATAAQQGAPAVRRVPAARRGSGHFDTLGE